MPAPSIYSRMGAGVGGPVVFAFAQAIDAQADAIRDAIAAIAAAPNLWAEELDEWQLRRASALLKIEPDPSWSAADWLYCLRLHAIARTSDGSIPRLIEIAQVASPVSLATVDGGSSGIIVYVGGASDLNDARQACLVEALEIARPIYAGLQILGTSIADADEAFTFDDEGLGLDNGILLDTIWPP